MDLNKANTELFGFIRFKRLNGDYLLTNDCGEYCFLEPAIFRGLLTKGARYVEKNNPNKLTELSTRGFLRSGTDFDAAVRKYCSKNRFLVTAPSLHIVVATLRCDHECIYCQAKSGGTDSHELDMDIDTAKSVVDRIFECPSPVVTIEFQGGEPLINFKTVKSIVQYARKKNEASKKKLRITLVSNLSYATKENLSFLVKNDVGICTSLDGPEYVHNKNRILSSRKSNSYKNTVKWLKRLKAELKKQNFRQRPNALLTVSKFSLSYPKEIVDTYIKAGLDGIFLRPANKFTFIGKVPAPLQYSWSDFVKFYKKALRYILQINLKGKNFYENTALLFLTKILTEGDPNHMDLRSPCGAGIGQIAYNYNGDVYTCDEGRMLGRIGDDSFKIGNVKVNDYSQMISHPTVKAMCIASCLDNIPGCSDCVYKPYCGVCPLVNYAQSGDIFTQQPSSERCKIQMAILDHLFELIKTDRYRKVFKRWVNQAETGKK